MSSKLLTAREARVLVKNTYSNELEEVLQQIERFAKKGETKLHIHKSLNKQTLFKLKELGYDIPPIPSIATQKDGIYHTIQWA